MNFILDEIDQLSKGVKIGSALGVKFGSADTDPNYGAAWYSKGIALKTIGEEAEADVALTKAKELGYSGSGHRSIWDR